MSRKPNTRCQCRAQIDKQCTRKMTAEDSLCDECRDPGNSVAIPLDGMHVHFEAIALQSDMGMVGFRFGGK